MLQTPLLFIIFNRPEETAQAFAAIKAVQPARLFIAADGPRNEAEKALCNAAREAVLGAIDWPCDIKTLFRESNLGCKENVSSAISWFFDTVDRGIILEDDCVAGKNFFSFCEKLLSAYEHHPHVAMISGTSYASEPLAPPTYSLSRLYTIWGWATWKEKWRLYADDISEWRSHNKWLYHLFANKNIAAYYADQFDRMSEGDWDTWDVNWTYSLLKHNQFSLIPNKNLVTNIGVQGTHASKTASRFIHMPRYDFKISPLPAPAHYDEHLDIRQFAVIGVTGFSISQRLRHLLYSWRLLKLAVTVRNVFRH